MKNKHKVIRPIIVLSILAIFAYSIYLSTDREPKEVYYGTVEGETYVISSQVSGIITAVSHSEGDMVDVSDILYTLDQTEAELRLSKAKRQLSMAISQKDKATNPARKEDLAIQKNAIKQLESQVAQLNIQIAKAHNAKKQIENTLVTSRATLQLKTDAYQSAKAVYDDGTSSKALFDGAKLDLTTAQNALSNNELSLKTATGEIEALKEQKLSASLSLASAKERLNQLESGADLNDQAVAGQNVLALEDEVALVEKQLEKYRVTSPAKGIIEGLHYNLGELVAQGAPVATIVDPEQMTVTLYVQEVLLPQLKVGGKVDLMAVVSGASTNGHILSIAQTAMFTPMNVVTTKDRDRLVFPIKVAIDKPFDGIVPGIQLEAKFAISGAERSQ